MAFDRLEPIGGPPEDIRHAITAATIANSVRNPKKKGKPWNHVDFVPNWDTEKPDGKGPQRASGTRAMSKFFDKYRQWHNRAIARREEKQKRERAMREKRARAMRPGKAAASGD